VIPNIQTAGNYSYAPSSSITNEFIIRESYERLGIVSDNLSNQQLVSALNSCNLILINWLNKGLRQWMIRQKMEAVVLNQQQYLILDNQGNQTISEIRDCILRTQERLAVYIPSNYAEAYYTTGTPFSSSGDPTQAFNYYSTTPSIVTGSLSNNAQIGFNFNNPPINTSSVTLIGINSSTTSNYTLSLQTSPDNVNWTTLTTYPNRLYPAGNIIWQPIWGGQTLQYLQIVETSGQTLQLNQLYFSNVVNDIYMSRIARDTYASLPNKQSSNAQPNQYFFDKQISPALYLWPYPNTIASNGGDSFSPSTIYQNQWILLINYTQSLYDIGGLFNIPEIPARFYDAMIAELTLRLAIKNGKTESISIYAGDAENAFRLAMTEDTERTPIRISSHSGDGGGIYY
jgi:hypothetical protein